MWHLLLAGLGGFVGASLRYLTGLLATRWRGADLLMWSTLTVNVVGCFAIGLLAGGMDTRQTVSAGWRIFLVVGVLGGFTTYSAFGLETITLLRQDRIGAAFGHVGLHLGLGFIAVWLGWSLGRTALV